MPASCAFCGLSGSLTRDHVWPSCFLDRVGRNAAHFSHQSQRVHGADVVVGDVCADCNNSLLTTLDAYFCQLYDAFFSAPQGFNATVAFCYDYDLLVRSLLKIAFNSARSAGSSTEPFLLYREYILHGQPRPKQLEIFAELVSPTYVADTSEPSGRRTFPPEGLYRSAITQLLTPHGGDLHTRIIAVNSYYFHLVIPATKLSEAAFADAAAELGSHLRGIVHLDRSSHEAVLRTSPQNALSSLQPHLDRNKDAYAAFFQRRK